MSDLTERFVVGLFHGFRESSRPAGPCFWCGEPTTLRDAEDFRVCQGCQAEEIALGYAEMKKRYRPNH